MKKILLFGAGKSATVLIDYLLANAETENWELIVVDANLESAKYKIGTSAFGKAISFDIYDEEKRNKFISESTIVISLLPPLLHTIVAKNCLDLKKNLLTASYVDEEIKKLAGEIKNKGLLFLCEMGLDPGIDHMSAMKIIDTIQAKKGKVTSFKSHCGGLVAPESDDNPWHYKISWNPRNILMAGKSGAHFKENNVEIKLQYKELFDANRTVEVPGLGMLSWYPNRDSLSYASLYGLENATTFVRTTLRHPDFMYGWSNVVELNLTDERVQYETNGKSLQDFFKEHMDKNGFGDWVTKKISERLDQTRDLLKNLMQLVDAESKAVEKGEVIDEKLMLVDPKGKLEDTGMDEIKYQAAAVVAHKMHEANLTLKQLFYLGMDDAETIIDKGICNAADVMQMAIEKKLALKKKDKDMIVMLHEIESEAGGQKSVIRSTLIVKGENNLRTAMAKTVGLPLGIAAKLILNGNIRLTGLHIPVKKEIYEPVLKELEEQGIKFHEELNPVL